MRKIKITEIANAMAALYPHALTVEIGIPDKLTKAEQKGRHIRIELIVMPEPPLVDYTEFNSIIIKNKP